VLANTGFYGSKTLFMYFVTCKWQTCNKCKSIIVKFWRFTNRIIIIIIIIIIISPTPSLLMSIPIPGSSQRLGRLNVTTSSTFHVLSSA